MSSSTIMFRPLTAGFLALVAGLLLTNHALGSELTLESIQQRWDKTNFLLTGDEQKASFEKLIADADAYKAAHPQQPEAWVWSGIVRSSYAGARGGLGALSLAKEARKDFEKAIEIDGTVMQGSAYTSLGTLYFSVPGWPIGFGDDDKAEELLRTGLSLDPDGLDSNFFFAEYLRDKKRYDEARNYYNKALAAPARPGREIADEGRRQQIYRILKELDG